MVFRGTDTVAVLMEWVCARLVLHPDMQARVHEELGRRRRQRQRAARRPYRAHRPHLLQGRRGLQPHRPQRRRRPRAHRPARRLPALDQGHEAHQQDQGRGRVPCLRSRQQGHWRGHQALPGRGPPGEAGAVQPELPGRVGVVVGEPRRRHSAAASGASA